jgi:hypothetical protein
MVGLDVPRCALQISNFGTPDLGGPIDVVDGDWTVLHLLDDLDEVL